MRRLQLQLGFTLLEIMVVVFILGLLATLVTAKIMDSAAKAKRTKAAADVKTIAESVHMFKLDTGFYPSTADGLQLLVAPAGKAPNANPGGYLAKVPIDPWGNPYVYFGDATTFIVKSHAADGREGGEGDATDIVSEDL